MTAFETLKALVEEAMFNCIANGYGEEQNAMTNEELAADLIEKIGGDLEKFHPIVVQDMVYRIRKGIA